MLKLTNSFCRYFPFTFKSVNYKTDAKQFMPLRHFSKVYHSSKSTIPVLIFQTSLWTRSFGIRDRNLNVQSKLQFNEKSKQMSDQLIPTLNHVSYGGQFEIDANDSQQTTEPVVPYDSSGSTTVKTKQSCTVPSNFRKWEQVAKRSDKNGVTRFTVMSYNVLAQYLLECHPYLYTECASNNLKWKVRAAKLYDEILKLAPDILCLQEVQESHMSSFYAKFEEIGYLGVYKRKTGFRHDGCAIYFKQSLFKMLDHISVEYYQPEMPILNRDNIGLIVKLVPKTNPTIPIVVATTHLLYNPKRTDVRLAQMQVLLAEIDRFAYHGNGREYWPIILTGDFNAFPESAVVQLLDKGVVSASPFRDNSDWQKIGVTDNCQHLTVYLNRLRGCKTDFNMTKIYNSDYATNEAREQLFPDDHYRIFFNNPVIGHPLNLTSVYDKVKKDGCYEATTYQDYWVTVDYIYFSCCSALRLVERLRLPTVIECSEIAKLPNDTLGSDHLALAAVFELKPYKASL